MAANPGLVRHRFPDYRQQIWCFIQVKAGCGISGSKETQAHFQRTKYFCCLFHFFFSAQNLLVLQEPYLPTAKQTA